MKNHIFIFYFLCSITPLFSDTDLSSPMMMMLSKEPFEKKSSTESNIQNERNRESGNDSMQRGSLHGIKEERTGERGSDFTPVVDPSMEQRFQQTEELQFLATIAKKMQARMQTVLDRIQLGDEGSLTDSASREEMSTEEQRLMRHIADEIGDQTMNKMTEMQISEALIQEQERTERALVAYYAFSNSNDIQELANATENVSNYEQIKKDLAAAIRDAFIKIQRAYFSNVILHRKVEQEWAQYEQGGGISYPYGLVSSAAAATMPENINRDAMKSIELGSLARTAHQTDEELHRAFVERGYSDDGEGQRLKERRAFLTGEDDLDSYADELMRVRGGIYMNVKAADGLEQAYERYERVLNGGEINSDTQNQRSTSPYFLSAEERIAHDQAATISHNLEMMVALDLNDELQAEESKAWEDYQKSLEQDDR